MPSPRGFTARPTTDFAKESLFNILFNYFDFEGKDILDLFSGTGAISFEFASRGCANVTAIEKDFKHYNYIRSVVDKLKIEEVVALKLDVFKYLQECHSQYNIIFADPPYTLEGIEKIPDIIFEHKLLKDQGMLVVEHPKTMDFSQHERFILHKHYGSVNFSFFE